MRKIARIRFMTLRQDEQMAFNAKVLSIVNQHCDKHASIEAYETAAQRFADLRRDKSFKTSFQLSDLDKEADKAWSALNTQLKASMLHPLADVRTAATNLYEVFAKTPNPTELGYDEEYAVLRNLLSQLSKFDEETRQKALVDWHIKALQEAVDIFMTASEEKFEDDYKKVVGEVKAAAIDCYKAWQNMIAYLEVTYHYGASPEVGKALDKIDFFSSNLNRRLNNRKRTENIDVDAVPVDQNEQSAE